MNYIYNPVEVVVGDGSIIEVSKMINSRKYIVVSSKGFSSRGWDKHFPDAEFIIDNISPNPTIAQLFENIKLLRKKSFDVIVAIGGGSVIDISKGLSVLKVDNKSSIIKYLNGSMSVSRKEHALIAIPTTSGTGAEVTPFATIWDDQNKKKLSLQSKFLFPDHAIIDGGLSSSLGFRMTAISGLDALSHSFESLWNKNSTPYSKSIALHAIEIILQTLPDILDSPNSLEKRTRMAWASMLAGLCISQTKTAIAHSMSYPLTSHLDVPHGLASGIFLRQILHYNKANDKTGSVDEIYSKLSGPISLEEKMKLLYCKLDESNLFQSIKSSQSKVYSLAVEMNNPARSVNNIVKVSPEGIINILDNFFNEYS